MQSEHKTKTRENEELKEKIKYLEDALAALTLTVSELKGQVCDMTEKSWDDLNDSLDFNSEEDNVVEHTEIEKPTTITEEEITSKLENRYEFKWEDVEYWANIGEYWAKNQYQNQEERHP